MHKKFWTLVIVAFLTSVFSSPAYADVVSTFDSGLDGWTSSEAPTYTDNLTNPGGYLRVEDVTSDWHWVIAPTKFLGNWGSYLSVSADILGDSQGVLYPAEFSISGGGNTATHSFLLGDVVAGDWRTLSVNLEAPLWNVSGDWSTLTANVSEFKIRMDYNNYFRLMGTSEVDGLDNVRLAVPEPATAWLLCSGLIGLLPMGLKKRKKT